MTIFDALAWLIIARIAVYIFDDLASAARGKRSPRLTARDQRHAKDQTTTAAPTGWWGRTTTAAGGYVAGLVEDAATSARAHPRRQAARRRGQRAVDNVFVDHDANDGLFYADCDRCGWSSRPFRIEANAKLAGAEHAAAHRTEDEARREQEQQERDGGQAPAPAVSPRPQVPRPRRAEPAEPAPRPWTPTVIPGGDTGTPTGSTQPEGADTTATKPRQPIEIRHYTRCGRCNRVSATTEMPSRCPRCGADDSRLTAVPAPNSNVTTIPDRNNTGPAGTTPQGATSEGTSPTDTRTKEEPVTPAGPAEFATTQEDIDTIRDNRGPIAASACEMLRRCSYPMPDQPYGVCGAPTFELGDLIGNPYCSEHTDIDAYLAQPASTVTPTTKEITMINAEATGPDEIRAAFATAIETTTERSEELSSFAAMFGEVADRYESLEMAPSTVTHLREAAEAFTAAEASLSSAAEELEAGLADFNARDGHVAETVADAGNLASREVLVG